MPTTGHGKWRGMNEVRLIAPRYVKPFVKRQKNDAADAEASVEAALRPTMLFVDPKSADQQARAVAFRGARAARDATHRGRERAEVASL